MTPQAFFSSMQEYAASAGDQTGLFPSVCLAQWAEETGYGESVLALVYRNYAGIKYVDGVSIAAGRTPNGGFASYVSVDQFVEDYVRVLKLTYYDAVRAALTPTEQASSLGMSPYSASHYGTPPGSDLVAMISRWDLGQYDVHSAPTSAETPTPETQTLKPAVTEESVETELKTKLLSAVAILQSVIEQL